MTPDILFDQIVNHYTLAQKVTNAYKAENIYRDRQHSIASVLEDLIAHFIHKHISAKFPDFLMYIMIDYGIQIGSERLIPDIAIIINKDRLILASYLDIKTDLGYKRNYFTIFKNIEQKILSLRQATFTDKNSGLVYISPNLKWRTIVVSDRNISSELLRQNKIEAESFSDTFSLYFLSGNSHPNSKLRELIKIHGDSVDALLSEIEQDIRSAIAV